MFTKLLEADREIDIVIRRMSIHSLCFKTLVIIVIFKVQLIGTLQMEVERPHVDTRAANGLQESYLKLFDVNSRDYNHGSQNVKILPNTEHISEACPKNEFFYDINPKHMKAVMDLQDILMGAQSAIDFVELCSNLRRFGNIHHKIWLRAVISATELRKDTRHLAKPTLVELMPDNFIYSEAIDESIKKSQKSRDGEDQCVRIDEHFAEDNGRENRLWYFRENIFVNSQHIYWHMSYPSSSDRPRPDRRGELFYFLHHNFIARYDAERLAEGFPRVVPLPLEIPTVVEEGYISHLTDRISSTPYGDRPKNTVLRDLYFGNGTEDPISTQLHTYSVEQNVLYEARIRDAIDAGKFYDSNGTEFKLNNYEGIDLLLDLVERSSYSKNPMYFGNLHNIGHVLIGLVVPPDMGNPQTLLPGVMLDNTVSMRDPSFYRWHKYLDDVFDRHKKMLPPYTPTEGDFALSYPIRIRSLRVQSVNGGGSGILKTFWSEQTFDLSRGLDLYKLNATRKPLKFCVKHLDHEEFQYIISIRRRPGIRNVDSATVRIFMAPRYDDAGRRFSMEEQRGLFFQLDLFSVKLYSKRQVIIRKSRDSTLTTSFSRSYEELSNANREYCGCGWPYQLLLPKGNATGVVFDLFVMITERDDTYTDSEEQIKDQAGCQQSPILCGLLQRNYPYKYPMGYPFDRLPYNITVFNTSSLWIWQWGTTSRMVENLDEYVANVPNMKAIQVTIIHTDNSTQ